MTVIIAALIVSIPLCILIRVISKAAEHFDGVANMFFAVQVTQLRLELDELGYECPEWLKVMDDEEQPLDMPPPTELRLVKLERDKKEEE